MENIKNITFDKIDLKDGLIKSRRDVVAKNSVKVIEKRFEETGRIGALFFEHYKSKQPLHIYYDSDVYKWIEGVALLMRKDRAAYGREEELIDKISESVAAHQRDDGYINSYFQQVAPEDFFKNRLDHELYCAGHLIEAAVEYKKSTGKDVLFNAMLKFVDCIERAFITEKTAGYVTCGHEEIELALYKLYEYTGDKKHLKMAEHFLFARGTQPEKYYENVTPAYDQSAVPVKKLERVEGHAVMANYLMMAMADIARETEDTELLSVCKKLHADITGGKMYLTGGVGQTNLCEAFTVPYDLDNLHAYCESCAAIAFLMFNLRMQRADFDSVYADTIERVMYNILLSSFSKDGKAFFYENPLEIDLGEQDKDVVVLPSHKSHIASPERKEVFDVSCCPPNILRTMAKIADVIYSERGDALIVNQFIPSVASLGMAKAEITTDYPASGRINIKLSDCKYKKLYIRKPYFAPSAEVTSSGKKVPFLCEKGYICLDIGENADIDIAFPLVPRFVYANTSVRSDAGRVAVMRGPVVYCIEGIDNGSPLFNLSVDASKPLREEPDPEYGLPVIVAEGARDTNAPAKTSIDSSANGSALYSDVPPETKPAVLRYRPYFTFANRGATDMQVFVRRK